MAAKQRTGTRISVVIPARNEERTVGRVVGALRQALLIGTPLVDEIIVIDSDSTDGTGRAAERAGATVHRARDIAPAARLLSRARARHCGSPCWSPGAICWSSWTPT